MTAINKHIAMVRKFHDAFEYEQDEGILTQKQYYSRASFIAEEMAEFLRDKASGKRVGELDAMCDLAYFALGTLAILGEDVMEPKRCKQMDIYGAFLKLMEAHFNLTIPGDEEYFESHSEFLASREKTTECLIAYCSSAYWHAIDMVDNGIDADFDKAFAEVQRSNMSKLGLDGRPIYNDAGKILKGPNFSEPELSQFLR